MTTFAAPASSSSGAAVNVLRSLVPHPIGLSERRGAGEFDARCGRARSRRVRRPIGLCERRGAGEFDVRCGRAKNASQRGSHVRCASTLEAAQATR
jgi:hypothetical protein